MLRNVMEHKIVVLNKKAHELMEVYTLKNVMQFFNTNVLGMEKKQD